MSDDLKKVQEAFAELIRSQAEVDEALKIVLQILSGREAALKAEAEVVSKSPHKNCCSR
jgi:hypothetical protein